MESWLRRGAVETSFAYVLVISIGGFLPTEMAQIPAWAILLGSPLSIALIVAEPLDPFLDRLALFALRLHRSGAWMKSGVLGFTSPKESSPEEDLPFLSRLVSEHLRSPYLKGERAKVEAAILYAVGFFALSLSPTVELALPTIFQKRVAQLILIFLSVVLAAKFLTLIDDLPQKALMVAALARVH